MNQRPSDDSRLTISRLCIHICSVIDKMISTELKGLLYIDMMFFDHKSSVFESPHFENSKIESTLEYEPNGEYLLKMYKDGERFLYFRKYKTWVQNKIEFNYTTNMVTIYDTPNASDHILYNYIIDNPNGYTIDDEKFTVPSDGLSEELYFQKSLIIDFDQPREYLNKLIDISTGLEYGSALSLYYEDDIETFTKMDEEALSKGIMDFMKSIQDEHKKRFEIEC